MSSVIRVHIVTEKGFPVLFRKSKKKTIAQLPGGVMEKDETRRDCAIRELREEVSLIADPSDLVFVSSARIDQKHSVDFFRLKRELKVPSSKLCVPANESWKFVDGKLYFFDSLKSLLSFCLEHDYRLGWGIYDFLDMHEKWSNDEQKSE